jgi:putative ATPase
MPDLFAAAESKNLQRAQPLAARMRPRTLSEVVGQQQLIGEGQLLWRLVQARRLGSIILYGPAGTGKTTLARLLASETGARFRQLSAVLSGVKEVREVLEDARNNLATGGSPTLLLIDEIHRFNKSQQDALLPDVEEGVVVLVGATTSNPYFAVNGALVSRSRVFQLEPLTHADIIALLQRACADRERGLGQYNPQLEPAAAQVLADACDGDARRALGGLEIAVLSANRPAQGPLVITPQLAAEAMQKKATLYDGTGDDHYDCASALIKSIRGSDADAALYWLARMLEGGEDIRFICRRLVILASEDIGNADPHALPLTVAAQQACEFLGLPECQLTLAQAVTYLALAPKSNAATLAIGAALEDVRTKRTLPIPRALRDGHYAGAKNLGNGVGYEYAHNSPAGVVAQDYLGVQLEYYHPVNRGFEAELAERITQLRATFHPTKPV